MRMQIVALLGLVSLIIGVIAVSSAETATVTAESHQFKLPDPRINNSVPLDKALLERRSIRTLKGDAITIEDVSDLLWSAQGITDAAGHRTAGSAWDSYPLEIYILAGNVTGLSAGTYHYLTQNNTLAQLSKGDIRRDFVNTTAVPPNRWIGGAPVLFIVAADFNRAKDRSLNDSSTFIEVGMASQNLLLEVTSMGLGGCFVAGFNQTLAGKYLGLHKGELPIGLIPVGKKA